MYCHHPKSNLICLDKRDAASCVCTLPVKEGWKYGGLLCILIILLVWYIWTQQRLHDSIGTKSSYYEHKSDPYFIPAHTFFGPKKGYVFKTVKGKTGYYKDLER